jgi:hypothetical protein
VVDGDEITHYSSVLSSPSDVPSAYAIGKLRSYLMKECYSLSMYAPDKAQDTEIPFTITMIHTWLSPSIHADDCV